MCVEDESPVLAGLRNIDSTLVALSRYQLHTGWVYPAVQDN